MERSIEKQGAYFCVYVSFIMNILFSFYLDGAVLLFCISYNTVNKFIYIKYIYIHVKKHKIVLNFCGLFLK